jgi:hypothetical protein
MEDWKEIKDFEGIYEVSSKGNVKRIKTQLILKPRRHTGGYYTVCLWKNGKDKYFFIHRLVASMFIENKDNKREVNHKDGIKTNNTVENLEWVTPRENQKHASKIGLRDKCKARMSKAVVDFQTGIFYDSLKQACITTNCKYSAAKKQIEQQLKTQRFQYI